MRRRLEKIQGIEFSDKEDLVIKLFSKIKNFEPSPKPRPKKFKIIIIILFISVVVIGLIVY